MLLMPTSMVDSMNLVLSVALAEQDKTSPAKCNWAAAAEQRSTQPNTLPGSTGLHLPSRPILMQGHAVVGLCPTDPLADEPS